MIKKIILFCFCFIFGFLSSEFFRVWHGDTYQDGWNFAKKRFEMSNAGSEEFNIVKSISGEVKKIESNVLYLEISPIEPLADPELDNRLITINQNTKISEILKKEEASYQAELSESISNGNYSDDPGSPNGRPSMYYYKDISIDELKKGRRVIVKSSKNIKDEKSFVAEEIAVEMN